MITREDVLNQLDSLARQKRDKENDLCAIDGAMMLCRGQLQLIDQREAEEKATKAQAA
jgi:hypothetical protein